MLWNAPGESRNYQLDAGKRIQAVPPEAAAIVDSDLFHNALHCLGVPARAHGST